MNTPATARANWKQQEKLIQEAIEATEQGEGKTVRLVLDVPAELITLAGWLQLRSFSYHREEDMAQMNALEIPPTGDAKKYAKQWLLWMLWNEWFHGEYHELCTGDHSFLRNKV